MERGARCPASPLATLTCQAGLARSSKADHRWPRPACLPDCSCHCGWARGVAVLHTGLAQAPERALWFSASSAAGLPCRA